MRLNLMVTRMEAAPQAISLESPHRLSALSSRHPLSPGGRNTANVHLPRVVADGPQSQRSSREPPQSGLRDMANRLHWITGQVVLLLFLLEKRVRASKPNAAPNRLVRR